MNTTRQAIDQALQTARRLGAARQGPSRSARAYDRLSADMHAAGVVLGPDSTDQTAQARALADIDAAALMLEASAQRARWVQALTQPQYAACMALAAQVRATIGGGE